MSDSNPMTRAEIAAKLNVSRQAVDKLQGGAPATTQKIIGGRLVAAWAFKDFSPSLQAAFVKDGVRAGVQFETHLQAPCNSRWEPSIPLSEIAQKCIDAASEVQRGLAPTMARLNDKRLSRGEVENLGVRDYRAATGKQIKARWFRELLKRAIVRDDGAKNWERLEIYLPERLWRRGEPEGIALACDGIDKIGLREGQSPRERWTRIIEYFQGTLDAGGRPRTEKRQLLRYLFKHYPAMAATENALRVNFDRKYAEFREKGFIEDRRKQREREEPYKFPEQEWIYLTWLCVKLKNVALGWLEFLESTKLPPEAPVRAAVASDATKAAFPHDASTGQRQVPKWIREKLTPTVKAQQDYIRGPKNVGLNRSYADMDPDRIAAGDSDEADDKTIELAWWEDTPDGLWFGQGQLIVWIDERSWLITNHRLVSDPAYTGFTLRNSWADKALEWGLPRIKIKREGGIWESSRVFAGRAVDPEEADQAIRRLGIRFEPTRYAKGKMIERVFGSMSALIQLWPGYAGRNQAVDKWDRVQRDMQLVRSGKEHPRDLGFWSKSQLMEALDELRTKLNGRTKYGKYHTKWIGNSRVHLSPKEAYQEFFTTKLVKIPEELARMVRANLIKDVLVGRNGIKMEYGKRVFIYKNSAELGRYRGYRVAAWFNPEDPSTLAVTDLNGKNQIVVPLEPLATDDPESIKAAHRANRNFESYHKELSSVLKPRAVLPAEFVDGMFRPTVIDSRTLATEQEFKRQEEQIRTQRKAATRTRVVADKAARELNVGENLRATINDPEQAEALSRMAEYKRQHKRAEAESAERTE